MVLGSAAKRLKELRGMLPPVQESLEFLQNSAETKRAAFPVPGVEATLITDFIKVGDAIQHLLSCEGPLGLDIETCARSEYKDDKDGGLAPRKSTIRLIQVYDGLKSVFVFDLAKLGSIPFPHAFWGKPMVAHNAVFELKHLVHTGVSPSKLGCSLLADRVLNGNRMELKPELGLSIKATLKDLAKELLGIEISVSV